MLYAHFDYERQIGEAFATEEAEPKGIGVNGIAPGPIWTPLQVFGGASWKSWKSSAANCVRASLRRN
jgi:NAD(P)-dependent dehydrogenase (short-subunit alcohol dehydrogenase family)